MSNAFEFSFDPGGLEGLALGLRSLTGQALGAAAIEALNAVTVQFDRDQRKAQNAGINLSDPYISERTHVTLATNPGNPRAEVRTEGSLTRMALFDAQTKRDPGKTDRLGRKMGRRQAGVSVSIKRGRPEYHFSWFVLPLKNAGGKSGVFVREPGGKAQHLYGVSPYSLARFQARELADDVAADLANRGAAEIADAIERALP